MESATDSVFSDRELADEKQLQRLVNGANFANSAA